MFSLVFWSRRDPSLSVYGCISAFELCLLMMCPPTPPLTSKIPNSNPAGSLNPLTFSNPTVTEASLIPPPRTQSGGGSQQQGAPHDSSKVDKLNFCLLWRHHEKSLAPVCSSHFVFKMCWHYVFIMSAAEEIPRTNSHHPHSGVTAEVTANQNMSPLTATEVDYQPTEGTSGTGQTSLHRFLFKSCVF